MISLRFEKSSLESFERALRKAPEIVEFNGKRFLTLAKAELLQTIMNDPWEIGDKGGGVPVDSGHLRDTHRSVIHNMQLTILPLPNTSEPNYADWVHGGTRKLEERPWLDYAMKANRDRINKHSESMLEDITQQLAS